MLEIFLIIAISKKIAAMLNEKGRSAAGYVILFVVLWFGGEVVGGVIGAIVSMAADPNPNAMNAGFPWMAYLMALVGAAIGGGIGYAIAAAVPAVEKPGRPDLRDFDDDDEDDYERERRRRRRKASADDGKIEEDRSRGSADDGKFEEDRSGH
jgi:hypothetical protein